MAFADYIAERMLKGTPIAPQQQTPQPQPQPQQQQIAETPSADPTSQRITATRVTPDDIAMDMLGQAFSQQMNLLTQTSDDVYQSAYQTARQAGSTMDEARQFAREKASSYQNRRVDALSNAFLKGGVDENGTITRDGVGILAQIANERPEMVNMLGNMYQTPQGATKYAQDIAKMTMNSNLHLKNAKEMAGVNFDYQQRGADAQAERQMALYDYKARLDEAVRQGRQQEALQMAVMLGKAQGLSDEQAFIEGLGYVLGGGSRGNSGRGASGTRSESGDGKTMSVKEMKERRDYLEKEMEHYLNKMDIIRQQFPNDYDKKLEYKKAKQAYDNANTAWERVGERDVIINTDDFPTFATQMRTKLQSEGYMGDIDAAIQRAWKAVHQGDFSGEQAIGKLIAESKNEPSVTPNTWDYQHRDRDVPKENWVNKRVFPTLTQEDMDAVLKRILGFFDPDASKRAYQRNNSAMEAARDKMTR